MTAFAQGVAASDPASRQQQSFAGSMPRDGVQRVMRAGGIKAALRAENRAEQQLICTDAQKQRALDRAGNGGNVRCAGHVGV